jgi:hypothetical protein
MCLHDTPKINENNLLVKQSLRLCQAKSLWARLVACMPPPLRQAHRMQVQRVSVRPKVYKYKVQVTIP